MKKYVLAAFGTTVLLTGMIGAAPAFADSGQMTGAPTTTTSSPTTAQSTKNKILENTVKVTKEQAVAIAKAFTTIPADYKQDNISFNSNWYPDNRSVWVINWNKSQDQVNGSISINVDANSGEVIGFNSYENDPSKKPTYPPKVSQTEAVDVAKAFIAKHYPDKVKEVRYDDQSGNQKPPLNGDVLYTLRFDRVVNDLNFQDNYFSINVDGNGTVTGMDYRWNNNLSFPSTQGMLSQQEANQRLKASLPFQLNYLTLYGNKPKLPILNGDQSLEVVLEYSHLGDYSMMDAQTGKWLNYTGAALKDPLPSFVHYQPLAAQPVGTAPVKGQELTQDQAAAQVKEQLKMPVGLTLQNANYSGNWGPAKAPVWSFSWSSSDNKTYVNATVQADTGEILSFNLSNPDLYQQQPNGWTPKYSYDEAKTMAMDALKKWVGYKENQLTFNANDNNQPATENKMRIENYTFDRLMNGVLVPSQQISVGVDRETGEIVSFNQNWDETLTFPDVSKAVSVDQAKSAYLDQFTFEPTYKFVQQADSTTTPKVILVYQLMRKNMGEVAYFDAIQNQWLSESTGEPINQNKDAVDIKGSWAEKPLQLMVDYGALKPDKNGKVYPNQPVTKGQMVMMLMLATHPDPIYYEKMASSASKQAFNDVSSSSPYYNYIQVAAQKGWIDVSSSKFNPDQPVTREELADLIVHALNYDKLASVPGLFNLDFKDASSIDKKGDVAIVSHLGIMTGSNNTFHPKDKATKAEAAVSFYKFLQVQSKYSN